VRKASAAPSKMEAALLDETEQAEENADEAADAEEEQTTAGERVESDSDEADLRRSRRRRRRGRRGGRRNREEQAELPASSADANGGQNVHADSDEEPSERLDHIADEAASSAGGDLPAEEQSEQSADQSRARVDDEARRSGGRNGPRRQSRGGRASDSRAAEPETPVPPNATLQSATKADDRSETAEAETAARRWMPPQPTVDRTKVRPKAGWWQRRSEN